MSLHFRFGLFAALTLTLFAGTGALAEVKQNKPSPSPTPAGIVSESTAITEMAASVVPASATLAGATAPLSASQVTFNALLREFTNDPAEKKVPNPSQLMSYTQGQPTLHHIGKMLISLSLVILLALAVAWFARKFVVKNRTLGGGHIDLLGTYALSQKSQVHLIRAGNEHFLIGEGSQSVSLISRVQLASGEPETYEALPYDGIDETPGEPEDMTSFGDRLTHWQNALDDRKMKQEVNASLLFLQGLSQRLKNQGGKDD